MNEQYEKDVSYVVRYYSRDHGQWRASRYTDVDKATEYYQEKRAEKIKSITIMKEVIERTQYMMDVKELDTIEDVSCYLHWMGS